jgi:hypothetical protein
MRNATDHFSLDHSAQAPGAWSGRQDGARRCEDGATGLVEVVPVLVVAEQHRINWADGVDRERRARCLVRRGAPSEAVPTPRRVERGVGEEAPSGDLDEHGWPTDVGENDAVHAVSVPRR